LVERLAKGLHDKARSDRRIEPGHAGLTEQNDVDIELFLSALLTSNS
jgi:hypothetical protein